MSSNKANTLLEKFREHALAHFLLDGQRGLEIGASAHNPFGLNARNVAPKEDFDHYAQESHRLFGLEPAPVDIWAYAWDIPVPDQSEDFVISSHVVEHLPNPISTFIEWNRVTRNAGHIFMIVPIKGALPEDKLRELTPLQHFIEDYEQKLDLDAHPVHDVPGGRMGHYHTFSPESLLAIVDYMRAQGLCDWKLIAREDVDTKVGNGFTLVFEVIHQHPIRHSGESPVVAVTPTQDRLASLINHNGNEQPAVILAQYVTLREEFKELKTEFARRSAKLDFSTHELGRYEREIEEYRKRIAEYELAFAQITSSQTFSIVAMLWRMRVVLAPHGSFRERVIKSLLSWRSKSRAFDAYSAWIAQTEPSKAELTKQRATALRFPYQPLISILMPVYKTPPELLRAAIESVLSQTYDRWELCIAEGNSGSDELRELLQEYALQDKRIRFKVLENNLGISGNSNECLSMADGEFIALLDHDDLLAPSALFEVARLLNRDRTIDFIYSDRDKISEDGRRRYDPFFKPDWSPEIMFSANYLTHFTVIRKKLATEIGGFDPRTDGAQDWDFFLRVTERTSRVAHVPKVLYHWRSWSNSAASSMRAKPYARDAQKYAISEHLRRQGLEPEVTVTNMALRTKWPVSGKTRVSIILAMATPPSGTDASLRSILSQSSSQNHEVILITSENVSETWIHDERLQVFCAGSEFHYARMTNLAAQQATGNVLIFLGDGLQPITPDWLEEMTRWIERPGIGVVGARILKSNHTLEHAGLIVDENRQPYSFFAEASIHQFGLYQTTDWYRNFLAVSGDCLVIRSDLFKDVGGFDEGVRSPDVDLCLRVRDRGFRVVYTPFAVFKQTRRTPSEAVDYDTNANDLDRRIFNDPYYNSNLKFALRKQDRP